MTGQCDKHSETMDRIFNEIHDSNQKLTKIEAGMDELKEFKTMVHKIMFGNGNPGILGNLRALSTQVILQWALLLTIIASIIHWLIRFKT